MQPHGCMLYFKMKTTFKALADETRRKLLDELYMNNGQTLTQLCGLFDMSRQAVTKHLCLLEAANLVTTVWDGREKLDPASYWIADPLALAGPNARPPIHTISEIDHSPRSRLAV